jgi:hypothetical protein
MTIHKIGEWPAGTILLWLLAENDDGDAMRKVAETLDLGSAEAGCTYFDLILAKPTSPVIIKLAFGSEPYDAFLPATVLKAQ